MIPEPGFSKGSDMTMPTAADLHDAHAAAQRLVRDLRSVERLEPRAARATEALATAEAQLAAMRAWLG
jgi:hypothetical protein